MSHTCHAHGCKDAVPPRLLFCLKHWRQLPAPAQRVIWREYTPGQELRKDPTERYLLAQACAVALVAFRDGSLAAREWAGAHVVRAVREAVAAELSADEAFRIVREMGGGALLDDALDADV